MRRAILFITARGSPTAKSRGKVGYPFQPGTSLNAAGINYETLKAAKALKRFEMIEGMVRPNN